MINTKGHPRLFCCCLMIALLCIFDRNAAGEFFESRTVTIGVYENAPKVFTSESGKPSGFLIDLIEHIAKAEGWSLRYIPGTWSEGMSRLEKGEIDLMPDVAMTIEREKTFAFHTIPVLSSWSQVYARKGSGIQSILDLNGKKLLVLDGSVQQEKFSRFTSGFGLDVTLQKVPDYAAMFAAVANGEADAAITNRFYGMMHAKSAGLENTAVMFDPSDHFFAAPLKSKKALHAAIDRYLADMKHNPQSIYYTLLKKWTSEEVEFKLPLWFKIAGIGGIGFLVLSLVGGVILKHQVDLRTRELKLINQEMEQRISQRTAELAAINKEQNSIFETASTGIVLMRDRVIVHCNRKLEEIFGYAPGELTGKPTRIWYPDEEDCAVGDVPVYDHLGRGETHTRSQQLMHKNGSLFWARISCRAFDARFPLQGAVAIIEDISEERAAEEQLRVALDNAQAADRIKSAFLATMSHELRTPLNSIIGFTGIMLQGLAGPLNEEQHKQMSMVQNSSRHLLALINDVLDISKIEAGQLVLGRDSFDLKTSIEKMVKSVSPLAVQKGIDLRVDITPNIGTINTDQRRLEQVILNLLSNAVKFTEKGYVQIACRSENNCCLLSFTDTGIGMQAEEISGLFQPFHQIDTGLARRHEGTGLGLSISKKIIEMMKGSIEVESRWMQGSTFTVRIPGLTGGLP